MVISTFCACETLPVAMVNGSYKGILSGSMVTERIVVRGIKSSFGSRQLQISSIALTILVALYCQLDQAIQQLRVRETARLP